MSEPLTIRRLTLADGSDALNVIGVVDRRTAPYLRRRLIDETSRFSVQPPRHLRLDLNEVTFVDQTGLDTLLAMADEQGDGFCTLEVVDLSPGVVRMLHEAHLDGASGTPPKDQPPWPPITDMTHAS